MARVARASARGVVAGSRVGWRQERASAASGGAERGADDDADDDAADDDAADDDAADDDAADAARAAATRPVRGDPARRSAATKGPIPTRHRRVPAPERLLLAERRTYRAPPRATLARREETATRATLARREETATRDDRVASRARDARPRPRRATADERQRGRRAPARQTSAIHVWRDYSRLVIGASAERARDSRLIFLFVRVFVQRAVRARRRRGSVDCSMLSSEARQRRFVHLTHTRASFLSRPSRGHPSRAAPLLTRPRAVRRRERFPRRLPSRTTSTRTARRRPPFPNTPP